MEKWKFVRFMIVIDFNVMHDIFLEQESKPNNILGLNVMERGVIISTLTCTQSVLKLWKFFLIADLMISRLIIIKLTDNRKTSFKHTLFLVADQCLQSNGGFHFNRHLFVVYQILLDQLHGIPQHNLVMETQRAEAVQHPAGLPEHSRQACLYNSPTLLWDLWNHHHTCPLLPFTKYVRDQIGV